MRIVGWLILTLINTILITTIVNIKFMGPLKLKLYPKENKKKYIIEKKNRIDLQKNFECSAFSSSYVLRHFNIEADGNAIYEIMPNKMSNGYVYPKGIKKLLSQYGLKATYCIGTINSLKKEVTKGVPVIVMIRYQKYKNWLHFVPVVGYDEDFIYLAESLGEMVNSKDTRYNRAIKVSEFKKLWSTSMLKMPLYTHTYYSIVSKKQDN